MTNLDDKTIPELPLIDTPVASDLMEIVDVNDTTDSADGSSKHTTLQKLSDFFESLLITTAKIKAALGITTLSGSNTGDETNATIKTKLGTDLTDKADKSNVLELDNSTSFTPDNDYEPATKKYVDDSIPVSSNVGGIFRQAIINGGCQVNQGITAVNLTDAKLFGPVDMFYAKGAGTAVSAGTITQLYPADIGYLAYALFLSGVTLTGTGKVHAYTYIESANAAQYKNRTASFKLNVLHNVGSAIDYVIKINKANAANNFSAVTNIATSSAQSVPNTTDTIIKLENVVLGDCSNGIEIEIEASCGAITTKSFEYTNWQFNEGTTALSFVSNNYKNDLTDCKRYYQKYTTLVANELIGLGNAFSTTQAQIFFDLGFEMMKQPTLAVSNVADFIISDSVSASDTTNVTLASNSSKKVVAFVITVASGLTQYRGYAFDSDATTGRWYAFDARAILN